MKEKVTQGNIGGGFAAGEQQNICSDQSWSIILSTAVAELGCCNRHVELDYSLPPQQKS